MEKNCIGLLFCRSSSLLLFVEISKNTRNELARPVMGTIFLVSTAYLSMHTVKPCYFLQHAIWKKIAHKSAIRVLYIIRNSSMIRLDMATKRKIGLENLQKFDYDQITIVI